MKFEQTITRRDQNLYRESFTYTYGMSLAGKKNTALTRSNLIKEAPEVYNMGSYQLSWNLKMITSYAFLVKNALRA